jgi:hypothetical protein
VAFPDSVETAITAIYVFAHEAVGRTAASAIIDNTTPAQHILALLSFTIVNLTILNNNCEYL